MEMSSLLVKGCGLRTQGLWTRRDLYRATPAAIRGLGFSGHIRRTLHPIQSPLTTHKGMWTTFLTEILRIWSCQLHAPTKLLEELFAKNGIKSLIVFYFQYKKANAKNNSEKFYHSFILFNNTFICKENWYMYTNMCVTSDKVQFWNLPDMGSWCNCTKSVYYTCTIFL
jgi:hypothetical protein